MNHKTEPWRTRLAGNTELDALLDRVREDKADPSAKNRNAVAYDCWRMFEDLAARYKEELAMRDRYKRQSNSWRDKAFTLDEALRTAAEDTCSLHCRSVKRTGEPWTHSERCQRIQDALAQHCQTTLPPSVCTASSPGTPEGA